MTSCQGQGGTGVLYSYAQLMGLWVNNGGPAAVAAVAAAVAEAESGGCSTALNPTDNNGTQSSFGLWQISNGTHAPPAANWSDGNVNAQLAVAKFKGAGNTFRPWGTYNTGAYRAFLNGSTTPDTSVPGGGSGISTTGLLTPSDCIWKLPQIPLVGTPGCILSYGQARALLGGGLMLAGGFTALMGLLVLAAAGLKQSGAAHAAGSALETAGAGVAFVPGAEPAGLAIAGAGAAAKRAGSSSGASQSVARRRQARAQRAAPAAKTPAPAAPAPAAPARTESTAREPEKQVEAPGRFNYRRAAA